MEKFKTFLKENKTIILLVTGIVIVSILIIFGIYRIFFYSNVPDEIIRDTQIDSIDQLSDTQKQVINIEDKKTNIEKLEEKAYSDEYKKYQEMSEKEKEKIDVIPRKEEVPITVIDDIKEDNDYTDDKKLPKKYNLKDKIKLRVEDQGGYGLCWDFASMKSLETNMQLHGLGEQDFSESHVDYMTSELMYGYRQVHDGGNFDIFTDYALLSGFVKESDVKYGEHTEEEYSKYTDLDELAYITKTVDFPSVRKEDNKLEDVSEEEVEEFRNTVKQHIMKNGSVYAVIASSGIDKENIYCDKDCFPDHAISIVGWDDNYSKDNFRGPEGNKPKHDGAYIILNSWGKGYGKDGYFYVSYDDQYIESSMSGVISTSKEDLIKISSLDSVIVESVIYENLSYAITNIDGEEYISEAALSKITSLDLSNRGLTSYDLFGLEVFSNLYVLDLSKNNITDVTYLNTLRNLSVVDLSNNDIDDVSSLITMENLYSLNLNNNQQVSGYSELKKLSTLELSNCNLNEVEDLSKIEHLMSLDLSKNKNLNHKSIKIGNFLYELKLGDTSLNDLNELKLKEDQRIYALYLENNNINDLSKLEELKDLYYINLENNNISDISILNNLDVRSVNLSKNKITDLSKFNNKFLESIDLTGNKKLENFEGIKDLYAVTLNDCDITNLDEVIKLSNVHYLYLDKNELRSLKNISLLGNLNVLTVNDNKLIDLNDLGDSNNLYSLSVDNNNLTDISGLSSLKNITTLSISGNDKIEKYELPSTIMFLNISNCNISESTDLNGLSKISYINTTKNPNFKNIGQLIKNTESEWLDVYNDNSYTIEELKNFEDMASEKNIGLYIDGVSCDYALPYDIYTVALDISNNYYIRNIVMKNIQMNNMKNGRADKKAKKVYVSDPYNPRVIIQTYYNSINMSLNLVSEKVETPDDYAETEETESDDYIPEQVITEE
ncbi:MAG: hypothetical protein E7160_01955 [Firmicutes bacterium]|nr:hypothetical protein [Bacillota bacterium]